MTREEIQKAWDRYRMNLHGSYPDPSEEFVEGFIAGEKFVDKHPANKHTVTIDGWVARYGSGPRDLGLRLYTIKPDRMKNLNQWNGHGKKSYLMDCHLFRELTWDDSPKKVKVTIELEEE